MICLRYNVNMIDKKYNLIEYNVPFFSKIYELDLQSSCMYTSVYYLVPVHEKECKNATIKIHRE